MATKLNIKDRLKAKLAASIAKKEEEAAADITTEVDIDELEPMGDDIDLDADAGLSPDQKKEKEELRREQERRLEDLDSDSDLKKLRAVKTDDIVILSKALKVLSKDDLACWAQILAYAPVKILNATIDRLITEGSTTILTSAIVNPSLTQGYFDTILDLQAKSGSLEVLASKMPRPLRSSFAQKIAKVFIDNDVRLIDEHGYDSEKIVLITFMLFFGVPKGAYLQYEVRYLLTNMLQIFDVWANKSSASEIYEIATMLTIVVHQMVETGGYLNDLNFVYEKTKFTDKLKIRSAP